MSAYTGRSVFDSLSPSSPAPTGAPATPSEPGVLLVLRSGARVFVPRPPGAAADWSAAVLSWLWSEIAVEPKIGDRFLRRAEVAYAEVTTEEKAEKAPAAVEAAVAQAVAAAATAKVAAEDANAAADEVLEAVPDGDVSDWTDEQVLDSIAALRHKIDNKVLAPGETQQALTDAMLEVVRLEGVMAQRRAAQSTTAFGTVVPPGTAN